MSREDTAQINFDKNTDAIMSLFYLFSEFKEEYKHSVESLLTASVLASFFFHKNLVFKDKASYLQYLEQNKDLVIDVDIKTLASLVMVEAHISYLIKDGYVKITNSSGNKSVMLTESGKIKSRLLGYDIRNL